MSLHHARSHDLAGLRGKVRKLAHRVHRKTSLLSPTPVTDLQEALNIRPTQWLIRQGSSCRQHLKILAYARHKQILFVFELCIQARLAHACGLFEVLNSCLGKAMLPKNRNSLIEDVLSGEQFPSSHWNIIDQFA